jgi:GxxExxY protein
MDIESIAKAAVDAGLRVHRDIGPGLYESVYESILASVLTRQGLKVQRQLPVSFTYDGAFFEEAFRADLVVQERLVIEIKSTEHIVPAHTKQLLTYLRILNQPLGLLMNFGQATFKEGLKRVANGYSGPSQ